MTLQPDPDPENRTLVELNQIPENLKNDFIALEDQHFYSHWGIDVQVLISTIFIAVEASCCRNLWTASRRRENGR